MKPSAPIKFFGSASKVARVCEISPAAVYKWARKGAIPYDKQCLLEIEAAKTGRAKYPRASRKDSARKNGTKVEALSP